MATISSPSGDLNTNVTTAMSSLALAAPADIEQRLQQLILKEAELKKTEKKVAKKIRVLKETEERLREAQARWEQMEKRMAANAARVDHLVNLNVGGQHFTTTRATLLQHKGSYFEAMLTSNYNQRDANGEYFIDCDPTYFGLVLDFLRQGQLNPLQLKTFDADKLHEAFQFFHIEVPLHKRRKLTNSMVDEDEVSSEVRRLFEDGTLLRVYHMKKIATWLPQKRFVLIYKASRDGFDSKDFHKKCDNKGATLVVIQSSEGGYLFGGYTAASWSGNDVYKTDPTAFLFTLSNPHSIPPTQYPVKPDETQHAIFCQQSSCAIFGNGYDIALESNSHANGESSVGFPWSYVTTTNKGTSTFTGSDEFMTSEVEVYSVL